MDECKLVTDLLPSYCDGLTTWETNTYVKTHLYECPHCSKLLESMQARQKLDEADVRKEQFRASLAQYEFAHKVRVGIIVGILVLLVAAFFVIRACSVNVALSDFYNCQLIMELHTDDNFGGTPDEHFAIYSGYAGDDELALILVEKNAWGFWQKSWARTSEDSDYGVASIYWDEYLFSWGGGVYDSEEVGKASQSATMHYLFYGQNALREIRYFPLDLLPDNVHLQVIRQGGQTYLLHVTISTYSNEPEGYAESNFDIMKLLLDNRFITGRR